MALVLRRSPGTIANHLASIRTAHGFAGVCLPSPTEFPPLQAALRGAAKFHSKPQRQKFPISPKILSCLIGRTAWGSTIRCLFLTLWLTFARLASLIPTNRSQQFSTIKHLAWRNCTFSESGLCIKFEATKTIQCQERVLTFNFPRHANSSVCLFTQLAYLKAAFPNASPSDPVFLASCGNQLVPLTRYIADPVFKSLLTLAGLRPHSFGWSSFRRGGATNFFLATGNTEMLRIHGDWKSSAYMRYLSIPADQRTGVVSTLQDLL